VDFLIGKKLTIAGRGAILKGGSASLFFRCAMRLKYAQDEQEAIKELARRHMLPMVQDNQQVRSQLRGKQDAQGPVMELLSETAQQGRVPMQRRQELREIERKYQNAGDQRLLSKAKQEGLGQKGTEMMRRLIERGADGEDGDNPDTHNTGQMPKEASLKDVAAVLGGVE